MEEVLRLDDEFIVIAIPKKTLEVNIEAKVWHNGEVITVARTMPFEEVREAFKEAEDGYMPSDAVFVLNPDYDKTKLEKLLSKYIGDEDTCDAD